MQRRRMANGQRHLQHDALHVAGSSVLDHEGVEEPPGVGVLVLRSVNNCFRYPTLDWRRPTEIADQLQISKQSVHELLTHVERQGYITRVPDPTDGRARIVRLTDRGRALEKTINQLARASEQHIAELLGERRFAQLRFTLEELASKLSQP